VNFSPAHLNAFSTLSHDRNPLHLDEDYCRRTYYGRVVVYGMGALLQGLGWWAAGRRITLRNLRAEFRKPMFLGEEYELKSEESGNEVHLHFLKGGVPQAQASFSLQANPPASEPACPPPDFTPLETPLDREWGRMADAVLYGGRFPYAPNLLAASALREFFHLDPGQLPSDQLNVLCWASYFVGMECPGRQAVLSRFEAEFGPQPDPSEKGFFLQGLRLSYDPEFKRAIITGHGKGVRSLKLWAFHRPKPLDWSLEAVRKELKPSEDWLGKTVFVSGSSRGFGSVIAKALALKGARVALNYRSCQADAEAALREIRTVSPNSVALRGDVSREEDCAFLVTALQERFGRLDALVLNAVPPIYSRHFLEQTHGEFENFVHGCLRMVSRPARAFLPLMQAGTVLLVSTGSVRLPEKQLAHYLTAKSAAEGLTLALSEEFKRTRFVVLRPPRMLTDQTNTGYHLRPVHSPIRVAARLLEALRAPCRLNGNYEELDLFERMDG
jgi:NAD(P)-dependent dehydrogenase (short-subunit alcohol dehydrogenase family)